MLLVRSSEGNSHDHHARTRSESVEGRINPAADCPLAWVRPIRESHAVKAAAWATILSLLTSGRVKPIVERTYKLDDAAEALRHLIEDRPFGRVVLVG